MYNGVGDMRHQGNYNPHSEKVWTVWEKKGITVILTLFHCKQYIGNTLIVLAHQIDFIW